MLKIFSSKLRINPVLNSIVQGGVYYITLPATGSSNLMIYKNHVDEKSSANPKTAHLAFPIPTSNY